MNALGKFLNTGLRLEFVHKANTVWEVKLQILRLFW